MYEWLVLLKMEEKNCIPFKLKAETGIEAMKKVSEYCLKNGYYGFSIEVTRILENIGIIEL